MTIRSQDSNHAAFRFHRPVGLLSACSDSEYRYRVSKLLLGQDEIHHVVYENSAAVAEETRNRWLQAIRDSYVEKNRERVFPE